MDNYSDLKNSLVLQSSISFQQEGVDTGYIMLSGENHWFLLFKFGKTYLEKWDIVRNTIETHLKGPCYNVKISLEPSKLVTENPKTCCV